MDLPTLPLERDGSLPPVALLLRWLAALPVGQEVAEMATLPSLNGCLPGLLQLGGIARLTVRQSLPASGFTWEGLGGGRIRVNDAEAGGGEPPLHHGTVPRESRPVTDGHQGDLAPLVELARLEDARAMLGQGPGAPWDRLLAIVGNHSAPLTSPVPDPGSTESAGFGAWNPLPFARRGVVTLPAPSGRTWPALTDTGSGAAYPVQLAEDGGLLVELPVDAMAAVHLEPRMEPAAGAAWEVNAKTLDNGLVRAEVDVHGQIERLCFCGRFVELAGPLARPLLHGLPLGERPAEIRVVEAGPVRARMAVSRETPTGMLRITYTLHAHEPLLRIAVEWDGAASAGAVIDHPTLLRHAPLRVAGELASEDRRQTASLAGAPTGPVEGCRWAVLDDGHGGGLALLASRPLAVSATAGHLGLPCSGPLAYALGDPGIVDVSRAALAIAVPLRAHHGPAGLHPPLRLAGGAGVAPLWLRPVAGGSELVLAEQFRRRSRLWIHPRTRPTEAWRSDARGKRLGKLPITPEGDGIQVDLHPGELALIRWL